jgi:competence protein CoiA
LLIAILEDRRVEAADVERGPHFFCPNCKTAVILKKGRIKLAHFAHKPPTTCTWASGETQAHMAAKRIIRDGLIARGLTAELEVPVLSSGGDRRADVLAASPNGAKRVAIEIQHQPLSFDQIETRTRAYMDANVPVVWVALLNKNIWEAAEADGATWKIPRFSIRPWQRWAHTYGIGELWFVDVDTGLLWRGVLTASLIHVEYSSWYDSYGNEESAGGYNKVSRKWRTLTLEGPYAPASVLLSASEGQAWSGKNYDIPAGVRARLVVPPV